MHDNTFIISVDQGEPKLSWKKSLLVICKILGLFGNIMTADKKHSLVNCDNFTQAIQMQLSKKEETFSDFYCPFLNFRLTFENFGKNTNLIGNKLTKIRTPKYLVRPMPKETHFRRLYKNQSGKRSQPLLKTTRQHLYNIY